jgi:hypothetical protein
MPVYLVCNGALKRREHYDDRRYGSLVGPPESSGKAMAYGSSADEKLRDRSRRRKLLGRFGVLTVIKRDGRIAPL